MLIKLVTRPKWKQKFFFSKKNFWGVIDDLRWTIQWQYIYFVPSLALPSSKTSQFSSVQSLSHVQLIATPPDYSMPGLPVHHQLLELTQTHVHWVSDAIQPSHPLLSPSPPALNISQHQGLFKCISSSQQVAKVLEFQLQHQSFWWIFKTDFL